MRYWYIINIYTVEKFNTLFTQNGNKITKLHPIKMSKENWKSRDHNSSKNHLCALVFHSHERYATSSFITQFISQDVSINLEIWYLPGCNQHRTVCIAGKESFFRCVYILSTTKRSLFLGFCSARKFSTRTRYSQTNRNGNKYRLSEYKDSCISNFIRIN